MSQVRYRITALTLGGLLLGVPLLTNGTANAEQIGDGGRQVVFGGGGVLGLSCRSAPSVGTMSVPAKSTVRVVNRTGHAARLTLGGTSKGTLPDDGTAEVVFHQGTTAVMLTPSCALGTESTPAMVTATPQPIGTPSLPTPPSGGVGEEEPSNEPSHSGTPPSSTGGTTVPGSSPPSARPTRTTTVTRRPVAPRPPKTRTAKPATAGATSVVPTMPQGGAAPTKVRTRVVRSTATSAPTFAGMPPGDTRRIVSDVPTLELPTTSEAAAAAPADTPSDIAVAQPVAEMRSMQERQPIGLLGMIAGVCVLGVATAAIRSFVSERASRSFIA